MTPSPVQGFRVEGVLMLPLMHETPGVSQDSGRFQRVVAGAGSDRLHTGVRRLVVVMQFRA